jgi:hypothetical protein
VPRASRNSRLLNACAVLSSGREAGPGEAESPTVDDIDGLTLTETLRALEALLDY